jgi:uncharacterized protein (UPF0335 family)
MMDDAEETRREITDAINDAAAAGYTKASLRAAIKIHRLDPEKRAKHDQAQLDLVLYLDEIEGRREAAE